MLQKIYKNLQFEIAEKLRFSCKLTLLSMINYLTAKFEKICHPESVENKQICVVFKLFRNLPDASYTFLLVRC